MVEFMRGSMSVCPRKSVGAVIQDIEGRYLCLYRKSYPSGLAFVAGHLDFVDENQKALEDPVQAVIREVREEVGVEIVGLEKIPLLRKILPNPCGKGYGQHEWFVYYVADWKGKPKLMESDKHEWVRFLTREEIVEFVNRGKADPAWARYIWPALDII